MGTSDIDAAVERAMRREATQEPPDYPDDPAAGSYGDRGECAVCGRPLDRPPQPEGPQFCDSHDIEDLRALADRDDRRRQEAMERRYRETCRDRQS